MVDELPIRWLGTDEGAARKDDLITRSWVTLAQAPERLKWGWCYVVEAGTRLGMNNEVVLMEAPQDNGHD